MAIRYAERLQMKSTVRASVVAAVVVVWCGNLAAREFERLAVPAEIIDPPWLAARRQTQIAAAKTYGVFCDFGFADRATESGITFRNRVVDDAGKAHIPVHYDHGNGLAVADVDGDGNIDIYFPNQVGGNQLWRGVGAGRFEDGTTPDLALEESISVTASFADVDNDGDVDLYVTAVRTGNRLLVNDGTGAFGDRSAASGLDHKGHSSAAVFFDYNRDGRLDLFLTNVGRYTSAHRVSVSAASERGAGEYTYYRGFNDAFSGHLYPERSERSLLFENAGARRFVEVAEQRRLVDESWSGDAYPLDANEDGWPDLYVLNMQGNDEYYENVRGEYFVRKSRQLFPTTPWGSMGVAALDYDNDGRMDLYVTDMHSDMSEDIGPGREKLKARMQHSEQMLQSGGASIFGNAFYRGAGADDFREMSDALGVENYWPWGVSTGDLNADGWEDLFVTASMNYPYRYGVNSVLLNDRGRRFVDAEFALGVEPRRGGRTAQPWFELDCAGSDRDHVRCRAQGVDLLPGKRRGKVEVWGALGSRSSAICDLDADGDLDIVTNDFHSEPMVLISDLSEQKRALRYLAIELVGTRSNRSGWGAKVTVSAGDRTYSKVRDGKSGYLSQSDYPLYFGLADAEEVDRIEVEWPAGHRQVITGPIAANRQVEVVEISP